MPDAELRNAVTATAAASAAEALAHFGSLLALETDCWDVHDALGGNDPGFVLRGRGLEGRGLRPRHRGVAASAGR